MNVKKLIRFVNVAFVLAALLSAVGASAETVKEKLESKYDYVYESKDYSSGTVYYTFENSGSDLQGAADSKGNIIFDIKYKDIDLNSISGPDYFWWDVEDVNGKHAFFDYSGRQILPFAFDDFSVERSYGDKKITYIEVWENGKRGAFDLKGKRMLPSEFDYISYEEDEDEGKYKYYWKVHKGEQRGAYTVDGKMLVPCQFSDVTLYFDKDYGKWYFEVTTNDKLHGLYDFNGKVLAQPVYTAPPYFKKDGKNTLIITEKSGKLGALDLNGNVLADNKYTQTVDVLKAINPNSAAANETPAEKSPVHQALIAKYPGASISYPDKYGNYSYVKTEGNKNYYGVFNADGKPILDPANRYTTMYSLRLPNGEEPVLASTDEPNSARLYDAHGNPITKEGYLYINLDNSNPAVLSYLKVCRKTDNSYDFGILGLDGQVIVPCGNYNIEFVQNPKTKKYIFRIKSVDKNYGLRFGAYGLKGEFLADAIYPDIESLYASPLDGAGLLDYLKRHYESASLIDGSTAKHKAYCVGGNYKYGIVDQYGRIIAPCEYSSVKMHADDWHIAYVVTKDGRDGVLDATGHQIIPCRYTLIMPDASGGFVVAGEKGWGFCNSRGVEVVPAIYSVTAYIPAIETGPDYIVAIDDNGTGAFTPDGSLIVPCKYDEVYNLEGSSFGGYKFLARKGSNFGLYDWSGRVIVPCQYTDVYLYDSPSIGRYYVGVTSNDARQAYDNSGNPFAEPVAQQQQQQTGPDWQQAQQILSKLSQDLFAIAQRSGGTATRNTGNLATMPQTVSPSTSTPVSTPSSTRTQTRMTTGADVQNRANLQRAYDNWGSQLSAMNAGVYPYSNGYTMSEVLNAQREMRSIRTDWNAKHPDIPIYEDRRAENWNGVKGSM